tara:strand:+ start:670 stop:936 length:267 start_codon:yes stop_codon:yes gene_type:complete
MAKVYVLKYYYNHYNQLDGYTLGIFKEQPSFKQLKSLFENRTDEPFGFDLESENTTFHACIGMLSRGEDVNQRTNGGDRWVLVEEPLL